ncbi:hypothetical protein BCR36DRAFT_587850 [Piromyces finnis]|uniref:Uncharacterized protein n=1 Tax=Piromyces finnis TaxID=1754191 RepID=A0A1Y1UUD6_9FUNG|nr:hypothetical protein BCR36DRAFT_587850 [Piromyces finnis]|eukprot:ORX41639.1 hypothetical protein BCR36DRAFT_587850 [Piromyces finnis]
MNDIICYVLLVLNVIFCLSFIVYTCNEELKDKSEKESLLEKKSKTNSKEYDLKNIVISQEE